jgi:hypothetical protein
MRYIWSVGVDIIMSNGLQNMSAEMVREHLEQGKKYVAKHKDEEGRGPLYDRDRKFMGIIPARSQTLRGLLYGVWLAGVEGASTTLQNFFTRTYAKVPKLFGQQPVKLDTNGIAHGRAGAIVGIAAISSTVAVAAAPFIGDFFSGTKKHKRERNNMVRKARTLVEEVTGSQDAKALMRVTEHDNEVLYVQRKRFQQDMQHRMLDDMRMGVLSTAPTAITSVLRANSRSLNKTIRKFMSSGSGEKAAKEAAENGNNIAKEGGAKFTAFASLVMPQVGEMFTEESKRNYSLNRQKYTAFEMILQLDELLRNTDLADGNYVDSFPLPAKSGNRNLAGYITEVFKQHQRDMERINPEHVTLRKALDSQLQDISKDIAEAIKRGDLAPLSLARLVGERMVVRNEGRTLAKPSEVRLAIEKMSGSVLKYLHVDSAEYYGESSFSRQDMKEALGRLQGEDRIIFASMVPDDILKEAGITSEQIDSIRESSARVYDKKLAQIVTGLAGHNDDTLAGLGLAKEEIKQLRHVAEQVKKEGEASIKGFRAKPTDPNGIERVVTNAVVGRVQGDEGYLRNLIRQGQESMDKTAGKTTQETPDMRVHDAEIESRSVRKEKHPKQSSDSFSRKEEERREENEMEPVEMAV